MPDLMTEWPEHKLWPTQITSIRNLEKSLAANKLRALIQMATGSGKTFTAIRCPDRDPISQTMSNQVAMHAADNRVTLSGPSRLTAIGQASAVSECSASGFLLRRLDLRPHSVVAFDVCIERFKSWGCNRTRLHVHAVPRATGSQRLQS
jgi:Type III restriction enzyme, res subunit